MHLKTNLVLLLALVALISTVQAQGIPPILVPDPSPSPASPTPPKSSSTSSTSQPGTPPTPPTGVIPSTSSSSTVPTSSSTSVKPVGPSTSSDTRPRPTASTSTGTSTTGTASPTPTEKKNTDDQGSDKLVTAGIVVGSVVVAAAIGIWVFRKWKLSPSRDFQSKIRGDDYSDYPRTYESDTVHLRQMDQTPEPGAMKSPYNAPAAFPVTDQYYDPNYATKDQSAGYGQGGATGYGQQGGTPAYDQNYGYNDHGYGHSDYTQGQAGYSHGTNDYAQSQVGGYSQGGYAQSNVGGGYQHGYEDYGRR
ncbi:hypothetical protein BGZ51_008390 [Haplosporangium sp. Z 767]|nr:hypothetical protein BGZ51_008390 [Haplosporangium sp. Z 767]KAF9195819.1 hypothetical protein BGZ50_003310 [Haplosporangium sp. Z 11]